VRFALELSRLTRRRFAAAIASLAAPLHQLSVASSRRQALDWRELAPGLRVGAGVGGNVLAVGSGRDVVLVDTKDLGFGQSLRDDLTAFGLRVTHVIVTHHHLDHVGGLHAFQDAEVVGHVRAANRVPERLRRALDEARAGGASWTQARLDDLRTWTTVGPDGPDDLRRFVSSALPALTPADYGIRKTFTGEVLLEGASERVELRYRGAGHTDNDSFVFFPSRNLLHTGDLLFHRLHPFIDVSAGATTRGWERCLDEMIALCTPRTKVAPGHGPMTDVTGLRAQKAYFQQMRDAVAAGMQRGLTREAITKSTPAPFADYGWPNLAGATLGVFYDELNAAK
jgi:cyclase